MHEQLYKKARLLHEVMRVCEDSLRAMPPMEEGKETRERRRRQRVRRSSAGDWQLAIKGKPAENGGSGDYTVEPASFSPYYIFAYPC